MDWKKDRGDIGRVERRDDLQFLGGRRMIKFWEKIEREEEFFSEEKLLGEEEC